MPESEQYLWEPHDVEKMLRLIQGFDRPWCFAGGYAIELFVGENFRPHGDIDIFLFHEDQLDIQDHFQNWDMHRAALPGLTPWKNGEYLENKIRDIWVRENPDAPWRFQLMLNDREDENWIFKRNSAIGGAINEMIQYTSSSIPYLAPQIQLLYKAKEEILEKDQLDFDRALPLMKHKAVNLLREWLIIQFPHGHDWIKKLNLFL